MESLVKAAERRRTQERDETLSTSHGRDIPTDAQRCPRCGGPSRPGAAGPCRQCRTVALCLCGCGRVLWGRSTLGLSRYCSVRVLVAFRASPPELRRLVLENMPRDE